MVIEYQNRLRHGDIKPNIQWGKISQIRNGGLQRPREIRYEVIKNIKDLKDYLRLRYLTFRYVNFIEENQDRLDIDPYDMYSTFLGAYDITSVKKVLIGTLRIISGDEKSECSPFIEELINSARDPKIRKISKRPELFPIMESFTLPENYLVYINSTIDNEDVLHPYELSRLAIRPDYWMHNIDVGLHHLSILDSWLHNQPRNDFFIAVHPRSRRRYERVDFKIVPGTGEVLYKHIYQLAIAMILDLEKYLQRPDSYRGICDSLLPHFKKHGFFTRIIERRKYLVKPKFV